MQPLVVVLPRALNYSGRRSCLCASPGSQLAWREGLSAKCRIPETPFLGDSAFAHVAEITYHTQMAHLVFPGQEGFQEYAPHEENLVFDKWAVLDSINWNPHPGQLLIAESTARHRVASCGRRFGKSDVGGHELVPEALYTKTQVPRLEDEMKRREFWIVGPQYTDAEKEFRVLYNELKRLEVPFDRPGTYNDPLGGSMHISLWNGRFQCHAKSALYPETLVGEGLHGVIMAEAAKIKEIVWTKYIRPTLADFNGWSLHTSTPEGKNHFYDKYQLGKDPGVPDWASWRMPAWVNPYVYKTPTRAADVRRLQQIVKMEIIGMNVAEMMERKAEEEDDREDVSRLRKLCDRYSLEVDDEILDLMSSMSTESFNQEIGADFTEFVGRVFKTFDADVHVGDLHYNPNWQTFAAVDYGFTNPNVWLLLQVGPWGEVNVLREFYERGLTANEFAEEVKARGLAPSSVKAFFPDPASPGDTKILEDILKIPAKGGTGGELRHRLDAIRKALKESPLHVPRGHVDRRPQLMFDRSCTMCKHEFEEYRYPELKEQSSIPSQELPMKKDDHTPEALGRFFSGFFRTPQEEAGPSNMRKARVRR